MFTTAVYMKIVGLFGMQIDAVLFYLQNHQTLVFRLTLPHHHLATYHHLPQAVQQQQSHLVSFVPSAEIVPQASTMELPAVMGVKASLDEVFAKIMSTHVASAVTVLWTRTNGTSVATAALENVSELG